MTLKVSLEDVERIIAALALVLALYDETDCVQEARKTLNLIERIGRGDQ